MNEHELMVTIKGSQWMYYRTSQTSADRAFTEFTETLENAGVNVDNIEFQSAVLRDKDGNDVDKINFEM